ncbi:MAG: restriction endonuclease subunit S [Candidatus Microsaccharimonas sp.]
MGLISQAKDIYIPKLRFSEFYDKWEVKSLLSVVSFRNGKPFETFVEENGKYKLITIDSVDINGKLKTKFKTVNQADGSLSKNDIIIVLSDIAHGYLLGRSCLIPENDTFVLNQRMGRLRPKQKDSAAFISLYINNHQYFFRSRGQGTSQRHIYERDINQFEIKLPSTIEQQKIAAFLTTIEDKLTVDENQLDLLRKYKKSVVKKIFRQEIQFMNDANQPYPKWAEVKIGDITQNYDNKRKPISSELRTAGEFPYYGANGVVDYVEDYIFNGEYVLVAEDGVVDISKYPVHFVRGKFWVNNHAHVLQGKDVDNIFLYYVLHSTRFVKYITGSAQTKLNNQILRSIKVTIPIDEGEQRKIADFLSTIDAKIQIEEAKLRESKKFRAALVQRMFV